MANRGKEGRPDYGHRWRKLAARVKRHHNTCWICTKPIDKTLPQYHPMSFEIDHIEPVTKRPDLALTYSNVKASHRQCNLDRRHTTTPTDTHSRPW